MTISFILSCDKMRFRSLLGNILGYGLLIAIGLGIIIAIFKGIIALLKVVFNFFGIVGDLLSGTEKEISIEEAKKIAEVERRKAIEKEKEFEDEVSKLMIEELKKTDWQRRKEDIIRCSCLVGIVLAIVGLIWLFQNI